MKPAAELHPDVYATGDGERSSAGSNYGDWRPAHGPLPHGYDFESRFVAPAQDPAFKPAKRAKSGVPGADACDVGTPAPDEAPAR